MPASRLSPATVLACFLLLLNSSPITDLQLTRRYETSAND
jgi:hypothetical protein